MSVRTTEELADRLARDLVWRRKEVTALRRLVSTASTDREAVLIRSLVAILYAHWEGFIKNTADAYIEHVRSQRLAYAELAANFLAYALRGRARQSAEQKDMAQMIALIEFLRGNMTERSRIPKRSVDVESNLSSSVLRNLTTSLGLDYRPFESKSFLIDTRLLANRNRIAHGDYLALEARDALSLSKEIMSLMESFRNQVENAAVRAQFRRSGS